MPIRGMRASAVGVCACQLTLCIVVANSKRSLVLSIYDESGDPRPNGRIVHQDLYELRMPGVRTWCILVSMVASRMGDE